ncbi:MAG: sigma-54-dependent Fis family transcriptional regulator [Myxococcales bacterium]|nr:sigma-54-dependent Fis family transcriptional regulator [Myxococcales bacterium]MCB9553968.1 sigma-54-dependent Fis family transcriptional regulator [Myxococcales bacterium]
MNPETLRVLLIDDDDPFRAAMAKALRRRGFEVEPLAGGLDAVEALRREPPAHAAVLDLRMPDIDGLEVLRRTPGRRVPVVVLTGHGTVPDAVEAMRLGAYTFLTKPVDAADLAPVLRQAAAPETSDGALVGESRATVQLRALIDRLADADEPILLTGETGTGKEVAARALHRRSQRAAEPFVAVNMACLPGELVESELFGHARGAFTGADRRKAGLFEETAGGTLFLDEIAELPLEHQAKLLRVLETRRYRPVGDTREQPFRGRLVAATHRRLAEEVRAGRFREDLFYRLQVLPLEIPPLRARPDDILPIARHWLATVAGAAYALDTAAEAALLAHDWPGNVREVVNLVRRVAIFAEEGRVDAPLVRRMLAGNPFAAAAPLDPPPRAVALPPTAAAAPADAPAAATEPGDPSDAPLEEITLEALERRHIERLLAHHRNITKVARILDINRRTLQRKLKAWGIDSGDFGNT